MSKNNLFHNAPGWVFVTTIIILIGSTSDFSSLVSDFFPSLESRYRGCVKLIYIVVVALLLWFVWRKHKEPQLDPDKAKNEFRSVYWRQVCRNYLFNIISLKIFPLFVCWIISKCIKKGYKPYEIHRFKLPEHWPKYEEMINDFFQYMFRVYIKNLDQTYEVKFGKDFQRVELRWNEPGNDTFTHKSNNSYQSVFHAGELKNLKIFTWITPFGLCWNLRRLLKSIKI